MDAAGHPGCACSVRRDKCNRGLDPIAAHVGEDGADRPTVEALDAALAARWGRGPRHCRPRPEASRLRQPFERILMIRFHGDAATEGTMAGHEIL
jgi:hypothetical protein